MRIIIALITVLTCVSANAADLYLFRDKAEYRFGSYKEGVIGYTDTAKAFCGADESLLIPSLGDARGTWLGNISLTIKAKQAKLSELDIKQKTAAYLLGRIGETESVAKLKSGELEKYAAARFTEIAKAEKEMAEINSEIAVQSELFRKGTDGKYAIAVLNQCTDLRLMLDKITAEYENVLYVDPKGSKTELILKAVNRSGVDINADNAYLLPSYMDQNVVLPEFYAWYVRPFEPQLARSTKAAAAPMVMEMSADSNATYEVSREEPSLFKVKNFKLVSDGIEKSFALDSAPVVTDSYLVVYPFMSLTVYKETSFTAKTEVYGSKWRVINGKEVFENVYATVDDGKIRLAAGTDKDISVTRKILPLTRQSDGFFGTKKRMKRGYTIEVTNLSGIEKKLTIVDRVPVSGDNRITIENIKLNGKTFTAEAEGKVKLESVLKAGASAVYEITFELTADKDLDVVF